MSNSTETEKDHFFLYAIVGVVVFAAAILMVKNSEHGKYQKSQELIAEDASNSAYKTK